VALFTGQTTQTQPDQGIALRLVSWVRDHGFAEGGDAYPWLREALFCSAPITHPEGNRRFEDLIMRVEDGVLSDLSVFEPKCTVCNDTKRFTQIEACDGCHTACNIEECDKAVRRSWPCPECKVDERVPHRHNGRRNKSRR